MMHPDILKAEKFGSREDVSVSGSSYRARKDRQLSYIERLKRYEAEKRQLWSTNITTAQYEKEIKKLRTKWSI